MRVDDDGGAVAIPNLNKWAIDRHYLTPRHCVDVWISIVVPSIKHLEIVHFPDFEHTDLSV